MELVNLFDYKEELIETADIVGVEYVATNSWGISGRAENPLICIVTSRREKESKVAEFEKVLGDKVGDPYLFSVMAIPLINFSLLSAPLIVGGMWVGDAL